MLVKLMSRDPAVADVHGYPYLVELCSSLGTLLEQDLLRCMEDRELYRWGWNTAQHLTNSALRDAVCSRFEERNVAGNGSAPFAIGASAPPFGT